MMSRIRTIKPEFFSSEDIVSLTPLARLFYVSLWCEADREGRLEWRPGTLKMRYFPGDNCKIEKLADELNERKLIVFYEVEGKQYAVIPTFKEHQIVNNRESSSSIPAISPDACLTRESAVKAEGKEGRKGREGDSAEPQSDSPPAATIPLVNGTEYPITEKQVADWQESYPAVNVIQELREMRTWSNANPANRKTLKGVNAFIVRWLGKEQDKGGRVQNQTASIWAGAI